MIFVVALIAIYIIFNKNSLSKSPETNKSPETVKQEVEDIINYLLDPEVKKEELIRKLGKKISGLEIMQGNDSYLRERPANGVITDNNLLEYQKRQEKYASHLEQAIKDNLEITYTKTEEVFDGRVVQHIEVLGYYYRLYIYDLSEITIRLLKYAGYDFQSLDSNTETEPLLYKSKIKGMEILNDYLQNYQNYEETKEFTVEYAGDSFSEIDITTLVMGINGSLYKKTDMSKKENINAQKKRIDKYREDAIELGTLDENNPLELK